MSIVNVFVVEKLKQKKKIYKMHNYSLDNIMVSILQNISSALKVQINKSYMVSLG